MIDSFAIAFEVAKYWLPPEEQTGDHAGNVMRALSRPQVTDPAKAARRLTTGWFVATAEGGYHRIRAEPQRPLGNRVAAAERMEDVIGDQPIRTPLVAVTLAKAGLTMRNFQPSYGDTLRINEAGKPVRLIDLANVRKLTRLSWRTKPGARWLHDAQRALAEEKFGNAVPLQQLPRPPFDDDPQSVLHLLGDMSADDIAYAIAVLLGRRVA
jgi:hypothetical protein